MARSARPWYRKDRKAWFVTINGTRHNPGPDRSEAFRQFHALMREPRTQPVRAQSFVAVADAFLDWLQKNRAAETFEWYRYRIERFCRKYPELKLPELKPFHVQQWVDSYPQLSKTSRRNYLRSIKRCVSWACRQGYQETDPINLTFETGCRPQDSLIVEARHFDAKNSRWVFPVKESKGQRQPRIVYLSPFAEELTKRLARQYPEGTLFRNRSGNKRTAKC